MNREARHKQELESYGQHKRGAVKEWNARGLTKDEKKDRMKSLAKHNKPSSVKLKELEIKKAKKK